MADSDIVATGGGQGFPPDNADGTPGLIGKDDYTRQLAIHNASRRPQTVVVGNIADIQRYGGDGAAKRGDKGVVSPGQAEAARGEFTRETERTGLLDAPIPADPPENKSPNPVDPTSTSPTTLNRSGTSTSTAAKK